MAFTDTDSIHYGLLLNEHLLKVKAWNMTVWNIMVEGYPSFVIV